MSNVFKVSSIARLLYQQMYKGKKMTRKLQQDSFLSTWDFGYNSTVHVAMIHILKMVQKRERERQIVKTNSSKKRMSFIITGMKWDRSKTQLYFFLAMVSSNHPDILSVQDWFWFLEHLEVSSNEQSAFSMHEEHQEYQKTIIMPFIFPLIMPSVPRLGIWEMKHLQKLRWKIQENGRRMITKVICFACSGSLKP